MATQKNPRYNQRAVLAFDGGSFSVKYASDDCDGSFHSAAASVPVDTLAGFNQLTDPNSFDIEIVSAKRAKGRWVIGEQAQTRQNPQRYTRNIRRFDDMLFEVFICAALLAAFPERYRDLEEYQERRGVVDGRWRVPVHMIVSIAPSYYGNAAELAEAAKGYYDFIDLRNKRFYTFTVESSAVVPEGFGIYATRLYERRPDGEIVKRNARSFVERTTAIIDIGGRTTDIMAWRGGKPIESSVRSDDKGIILTANQITEQILAAYPRAFPNRPTLEEVVRAITQGKSAHMTGAGGKKIDVSETILGNMNQLASDVWELYQNVLRGGQGIDTILYGAGGSHLTRPYMAAFFKHDHEMVAARDLEGMYKANALGAYLYGKYKYLERLTNA